VSYHESYITISFLKEDGVLGCGVGSRMGSDDYRDINDPTVICMGKKIKNDIVVSGSKCFKALIDIVESSAEDYVQITMKYKNLEYYRYQSVLF
jgi:hypothetical protein